MAGKRECDVKSNQPSKRACLQGAMEESQNVKLGLECLTGKQSNFHHWGVIIGYRSYEVDIGRLFNADETAVGLSFRSDKSDSTLLQEMMALPSEPMAVVGSEGVVAKQPDSLVLNEATARSPEEYGHPDRSRPGGIKDLGFETVKTKTQINEWIKEWVATNPRYHPFALGGKNCQHFCAEFVEWLSDGACALRPQIESWPEDQSQKVECVKTLRAAELEVFNNDMMADPGFVWNRRRMCDLEEDYVANCEQWRTWVPSLIIPRERQCFLAGLIKQIEEGDTTGDQPDMDRLTWDSWNSFKGKPKEECWAKFIAEFKRLKEEFGDDADLRLENQFEEVLRLAKVFKPSRPVPRDCVWKLYGLYKQIEKGDVEGARPPVWRVELRQKWDARIPFKGMSKRECMEAYIKEFYKQQAEFS